MSSRPRGPGGAARRSASMAFAWFAATSLGSGRHSAVPDSRWLLPMPASSFAAARPRPGPVRAQPSQEQGSRSPRIGRRSRTSPRFRFGSPSCLGRERHDLRNMRPVGGSSLQLVFRPSDDVRHRCLQCDTKSQISTDGPPRWESRRARRSPSESAVPLDAETPSSRPPVASRTRQSMPCEGCPSDAQSRDRQSRIRRDTSQ